MKTYAQPLTPEGLRILVSCGQIRVNPSSVDALREKRLKTQRAATKRLRDERRARGLNADGTIPLGTAGKRKRMKTQRFNEIIQVWDVMTGYRYDRVTNIETIREMIWIRFGLLAGKQFDQAATEAGYKLNQRKEEL